MSIIIDGNGIVTAGGTASTQGKVVLGEQTGNGTNTVTLQAPASLAADLTFTMPTADGTNGQYLQTNGSGQLAFATVPTTSPAGSTGQLQYNNAGAFGAISSGTSGQVLQSAGAGAAPTWGTGGGMTLLSQFNPTAGQTQFDVTNIPASSKLIRITMLQADVSTSGVRFNIGFSTDNGSTYSATTPTATTGGGTVMAGYYDFSGITLSGVRKFLYGFTIGGGNFYTDFNTITGVVNAMRFTLNTGSFNGTGTILVYAFI